MYPFDSAFVASRQNVHSIFTLVIIRKYNWKLLFYCGLFSMWDEGVWFLITSIMASNDVAVDHVGNWHTSFVSRAWIVIRWELEMCFASISLSALRLVQERVAIKRARKRIRQDYNCTYAMLLSVCVCVCPSVSRIRTNFTAINKAVAFGKRTNGLNELKYILIGWTLSHKTEQEKETENYRNAVCIGHSCKPIHDVVGNRPTHR